MKAWKIHGPHWYAYYGFWVFLRKTFTKFFFLTSWRKTASKSGYPIFVCNIFSITAQAGSQSAKNELVNVIFAICKLYVVAQLLIHWSWSKVKVREALVKTASKSQGKDKYWLLVFEKACRNSTVATNRQWHYNISLTYQVTQKALSPRPHFRVGLPHWSQALLGRAPIVQG